jgi:SAM-dependent methyltransferase
MKLGNLLSTIVGTGRALDTGPQQPQQQLPQESQQEPPQEPPQEPQQFVVGQDLEPVLVQGRPAPCAPEGAGRFPLPPVDLRMGYGAGNPEIYLTGGRRTYRSLSSILAGQGIVLRDGDAVLDWGCASGRVVQHFEPEAAQGCQVWGCDIHRPSIAWAKAHLSPPFRFFQSSAFPHLPFADGTFKVIYGLSVFTHLIESRDLWLLELIRVLAAGGCLILTIHDETTWAHFQEHGAPVWMPPALRASPTMPGECVEIRGPSWERCYTFFSSGFIQRTWNQYLKVAAVVPKADGYQTAVVMRKDS